MLSVIIIFLRSYLAMLCIQQPIYQGYTFPNPLVQGRHFFNFFLNDR
jgi:hypothetical protein